MNEIELQQHVVDMLIDTVRKGESGREFENPDREFILRYYLTHQYDPSIQEMIQEFVREIL